MKNNLVLHSISPAAPWDNISVPNTSRPYYILKPWQQTSIHQHVKTRTTLFNSLFQSNATNGKRETSNAFIFFRKIIDSSVSPIRRCNAAVTIRCPPMSLENPIRCPPPDSLSVGKPSLLWRDADPLPFRYEALLGRNSNSRPARVNYTRTA